LGKGKNTPLEKAADDYRWCLEQLAGDPMAEFIFYIAINISSPNTLGLRALQHFRMLRQLVATCKQVAPRPLLIKLAPDFASEKEFCRTLAAAFEGGAQGAIICNTTTDHRLLSPALQSFGGGLSGKPLADRARQLLRIAVRETRGQWPLVSSGGVFSPEEAKKRLELGADLVQVYTGLIYYGPDFAADLGQYPSFYSLS
ncbi:MAG: quinone-dependent dihydroorotate dehydrogenase, partial [Turneriella sp.]|nr:quinone-dependent dihydroorotate dehydrogenase [Turneriella sp.]